MAERMIAHAAPVGSKTYPHMNYRKTQAALIVLSAGLWPFSQSLAASDPQPQVARLNEIAPRLAACFHLPREDDQITVKLSFNRGGALIGRPRIMFIKSSAGPEGEAALANAMLTAMQDCTPLPFTTSLGAEIAGMVMTIRFVGHPKEQSL